MASPPSLIDHAVEPKRALLVAVQLDGVSDQELAESLAELARLADTLGHTVVGQLTQRRPSFDKSAYLGPGKVKELPPLVESAGGAERVVVLVDHEITPSQARNLEKAAGVPVLDRTAVILEIFHRHARSRQAKLQVEMVRLQYMAPRLRESVARGTGERQQGRGTGESDLELDRRKIRDRIAELKEEIDRIDAERTTQRARRRDLHRVALVGYTNAGKSTMMRALTGSEVYVADRLFATLETTVRALDPPSHPRVLVSDTVGFIRKLPHGLVASFKSTLDEALEASLVLHLVDASDPAHPRQMEATESVLGEIGAGANEVPRLIVYNKADKIADPAERAALAAAHPEALVVSAKVPADVARVRQAILDFFARGAVEDELVLPWSRQSLRAQIHERTEVLGEEADESGARFRLRAQPDEIARLKTLIERGG